MPKLSIIVPVYNVEKYLKRCLDSIIKQKLKDFELILVNDGSTDSSGDICDEYGKLDTRVIVIHKVNGGLSSARNSGLEVASGEFIGFVDSDDFISDDMYETLVGLGEELSADIVSGKYIRFEKERELESIGLDSKSEISEFNNVEALENYLKEYNDRDKKILTVVWDKVYKRHLFDDLIFPVGKIYEDGYVTYKTLYKAKKVVHINKVLYYYYQRVDSISNSQNTINEKVLNSYDDWRDIFRFINKNVQSLSSSVAPKYINKNLSMYRAILNRDEFKEYKEKIYSDLKIDFKKLILLNYSNRLKLELIKFILFKR